MIASFKCKETEKIYEGVYSKKLPQSVQQIARRKLRMLNNAKKISDLSIPPSNCLEQLKGNKKGLYSIRVNNQWRLCFKWIDNQVHEVEMIDYH